MADSFTTAQSKWSSKIPELNQSFPGVFMYENPKLIGNRTIL